MSECTNDTNMWMSANKLQMNNAKTDIMLCSTSAKLKSVLLNSVKLGDDVNNYCQKTRKTLVCI